MHQRPEARGDVPEPAAEPEGLGYVLRSTLSQSYDYFHLVVAGSLLWAVSLTVPTVVAAMAPGGLLTAVACYAAGTLTVGPAWVALYGLSEVMARRELPGLGHLWMCLRRFYWRAARLFLAYAFGLGGTALAAWFYQWKFDHFLLEALSLLWVYVGLAWLMVGLYAPAFLVRDDGSVRSALKKATILTLAHPGYTFLVLVQIGCVTALVALPFVARITAAMGLSFIIIFLFLPGFAA